MALQRAIGILCLILIGVASDFTDEASARLPPLFVLDDYDRCVAQKDGLYCLGVFELSPIHPSPTYEVIKEYSSSPLAFNRSLLHRGYCVSARCPSQERNASLRFERCVESRARRLALSARLLSLQHCTARAQHTARAQQPPAASLLLFQNLLVAVLALNAVGTVYDVATGDNKKKISAITVWSVRASWRRLIATYDDGDPRLKELDPLQGIKVVSMWCATYAHVCIFHYQYYVTNPQFLEKILTDYHIVMLANGTSLIQVFIVMSNFLVGYNMLIYMETRELRLNMLIGIVIKRFARLAPVHALIIGFAATWWPRLNFGPFYSLIENQSAICRRKFWSHVFFYNNLVDKHDHCLIPAWFIPVDMHLYYLACILIILLQHHRRLARKLFGIGFFVSSIACGVVSYFTGWQALIQFNNSENNRVVYANVDSFGEFYISSWGSLMACFLGLYIAYVFYDLRKAGYNFTSNKLVKHLHPWSIVIVITWVIILGMIAQRVKHPLFSALYIMVDRPAFIGIMAFAIIGLFRIEGINRTIFSWSGWRVPARLSLPVMLCHWLIINYITARPAAFQTSMFVMSLDFLSMMVLSYIIAVPIYLFVEVPVQRFISLFV